MWLDVVMAAELVHFRFVSVIGSFPLRLQLVDAGVVLYEAGPCLTQSRMLRFTLALMVLPLLCCWVLLREKIIIEKSL